MRPQVDPLIFDLDETLVDSRLDLTASVNHALCDLGLPPLPVDTVARFVGFLLDNLRDLPLRIW